MITSTASARAPSSQWWAPILAGFHGVSWRTFALILAINTGVALLLYTEETRPFWHPFITAQSLGLSIAYAVNAAQPWESAHPLRRLIVAVLGGTVLGMVLLLAMKGYIIGDPEYHLGSLHGHASPGMVVGTAMSALVMGLCVSLFFLLKIRDALSRAAMLKAEADRNMLSKQAIEAELKLMQAQVEPHFLFNTLASVQFLTETDPPKATMMLGHLLAYLRAALPQLRSNSTTLGQELDLAQAYLSIMQMRMGPRLSFGIDAPDALKLHAFPPMLLMSLVENAVKHGIEPTASGGTIRIEACRHGKQLAVAVSDDGRGLADAIGNGVGLTNLRERLRVLYGERGRFTLEEQPPHGARATIEIPYQDEH
jgi:signal transduction histidine kinase